MAFVLVSLGIIGTVSLHQDNAAPVTPVLIAAILSCALLCSSRLESGVATLLILASWYLTLKLAIAFLVSGSNFLDVAQAYKAYFYLIPLSFFVGKKLFPSNRLAFLTWLLLALFFVKYSLMHVVDRGSDLGSRPGLFGENNYELVLIIGMLYLAHPYMGKRRHLAFTLLGAVTLLSESRSGIVEFAICFAFLYLRPRSKWFLAAIPATGVVTYLIYRILSVRMEVASLQDVDRVRFLDIFVSNVQNWPVWEFLTGSSPITALSPDSCRALDYYHTLFSMSGDGSCYSVILHAYILRALFDQGIVGFIFLLWWYFRAVRLAGRSRKDGWFILTLLLANGASVSSFNSEFAVLLLILAVSSQISSKSQPAGFVTTAASLSSSGRKLPNGPSKDGSFVYV